MRLLRVAAACAIPAILALAGCGGGSASGGGGGGGGVSVSPGTASIDTNCTGCNNASSGYEQFSASGASSVTWSLSGGDQYGGKGSITASGQYTPPQYLTADSVSVTVTATTSSNQTGSATITVTPGFLQPLAPENLALGAAGNATITGYIAEVGGTDGINFSLASSANGSSGGQGTLVAPSCTRGNLTNGNFTYCSATYAAPAVISSTATTYVVGTVGTSSSKESTVVLLNTAGIDSNPADHQARLNTPISLGSSGGNNVDYDTATQNGNTYISDCCGGTLGSLVQDSSGNKYILSNNHVLARSDQASANETIIQPGLIDNNPACEYVGGGGNETPVGVLKGFVPVKSNTSDVDAAIATIDSGQVDTSGSILELGTPSGGKLAAAPPGTSSTGGKGESPVLNMVVAKSGRTTGLTCASISAINLQVQVSYFTDCAETNPYYTKTYTNQIAITGNEFSDAGDSGSLVVDTSTGEPVGLFFAGGVNNSGQSEGVASPAPEVLSELGTFLGGTYTFVGTTDHQVSCLNYGSGTASIAQGRTLTGAEMDRAQQAMTDARSLVNPSAGILGVATGKSSDHAGEAAVIVYVDPAKNATVPQTIDGVRTEVIPSTAQAVAIGTAPQSLLHAGAVPPLQAAVLRQAIASQQTIATQLMKQNPAFFGVGVGQSLDSPNEAALVIYVDRTQIPAQLPATISGLRTRYIIMDRLHVTRAYLSPTPWHSRCMAHSVVSHAGGADLLNTNKLNRLNLH